MKKTGLFLLLLAMSGSLAFGQEAAPVSSSTSTTSTSAQGNNQSMNFSSPSDITTRSTNDTNQNIFSSGTTRNIVEYQGTYTLKNVPSVGGPNLTTSNDTCMGSSSGSANVPGVGISFGTTWTDEHCKRLKMSRELWNKGMKAASLAMDCMDPAAMAALEMTGTRCPQSMSAQERIDSFGALAASPTAASTPIAAALQQQTARSGSVPDRSLQVSEIPRGNN